MDFLTEHFTREELACNCPCGSDHIQRQFIDKLEVARKLFRHPMVITSGVRCSEHNANVGGLPDSAHVTGWAVDVSVQDSGLRYLLINALFEAGFNRLGIAKTFIHVDCDPSKPRNVIWTY